MNKKNILLIFIIILAFILRVYKVSEYPAGLNADEAAIGYNAYSLIQTGKDEFGHSWPINFQSFNDFKPGLYFYLVLPFVKILGLNELAVRLPSVILGTLSVYFLFLLVKKVFDDERLALISSFLLSISPWAIHFSRGGWETNAATFFIIVGVYLFIHLFKNQKFSRPQKLSALAECGQVILSSLFMVLSMYTYHSARVISPLLIIGLTIFNYKQIFVKRNLKNLLITAVLSFLLMIPLLKSLTSSEGTSRFSGVGIFADKGPYSKTNELRGQHGNPNDLYIKVTHNQYLEYGLQFIDNYLRHFNGGFLFINGDEIQRNKVPETGQMYLVEIPFLILGIYFLLKKRPRGWSFILWWLFVSPVASALTFQSPHAIRALNMVIPLVIVTAYGILGLFDYLKKNVRFLSPIIQYSIFIILFLWNVSFYLHQYYIHYPQTYPTAWEYGFKDLTEYLSKNENRFDKIYITGKYDQPYILLAFYLRYSPVDFQKEALLTKRDQYGFSTVEHFSKYYFGSINWNNEQFHKNKILVVGTPEEIPDSATIVKRIYFKDGKTEVFRIVEQ